MQRDLESLSVIGLSHGLETFGHPFGVAIGAAGADLGTAGDRIPGALRPFYA